MKFFVSTHSGLFIVEINFETIKATMKELSSGYYYGLADFGDYILAARRIDPWSCKISPTHFEMWSKDGLCLGTETRLDGNEIIDMHEMALGPNALYICNLGKQKVELYDPNTLELTRALTFQEGEVPGGAMVNSLEIDGDDFWLLFHNRGLPSFVQHFSHVGSDLVFHKRVGLACNGSHNLVLDGDKLYYNASSDGAVHMIFPNDIDTEDWEFKDKIAVRYRQIDPERHTKGMVLHKPTNYLLIGISDKGTLQDRFISTSHIVLLNAESLKQEMNFELTRKNGSTIGNINEILLLD